MTSRARQRGLMMLQRGLRLMLPLALALTAVALHQATERLESYYHSPLPVTPVLPFSPVLVGNPLDGGMLAGVFPQPLPVRFTVEPGETLSQLLSGLGLEATEALAAARALSRYVDPRSIRPGQAYAVYFDPDHDLARFEMLLAGEGRVRLARDAGSWTTTWLPVERSVSTRVVKGTLESALEQALRSQDAPAVLTYKMADALQWDLDFNRDLRQGDGFAVLFEEIYVDGVYHETGEILALRYENRGQVYEAYRFGDEEGFYDADGRPMRKMFLRSPLKFSRITSRFSRRRFHPILKQYRPHYGVDYGAPTGTPVHVTASGTVTFAGWDRGGGKTIKVRHPGSYVTAYLHLSRFARGVRPGKAVRQGEVVGYVGSTGLSTASHLDYRVQHDRQWIDPLSLKSVPARSLAAAELATFRAWRDQLRASLDAGEPLPLDEADGRLLIADSGDSSTSRGAGRR